MSLTSRWINQRVSLHINCICPESSTRPGLYINKGAQQWQRIMADNMLTSQMWGNNKLIMLNVDFCMFAIDGYMFSYMWMRHCDEADHSTRPLNQTTSCCSLLAANPEKLPRSIHSQLLWDQILGLHYFNLTLTIHRAIFCWDLRFPEFLLLDSGSKLAVREGIPNAHWRLYLFFPRVQRFTCISMVSDDHPLYNQVHLNICTATHWNGMECGGPPSMWWTWWQEVKSPVQWNH